MTPPHDTTPWQELRDLAVAIAKLPCETHAQSLEGLREDVADIKADVQQIKAAVMSPDRMTLSGKTLWWLFGVLLAATGAINAPQLAELLKVAFGG